MFGAADASAFKYTVTPLGDDYIPGKTTRSSVSVNMGDVIVDENFEGFKEGTNEKPDFDYRLCSHYGDENINTKLTHGDQWSGHNVSMAGGAAALYCINPQDPAYLNTPKMDYSGTITATFKVKALRTEWIEENGQTYRFSSTTVMARMGTSNYDDKFDFGPDGDERLQDGHNFFMLPFYPDQGWCEVKIEFDNYSAYNDAFLQIASAGHLLIDDVKITQSVDKFIGAPVFQGFTGATNDSFTVSFTPVRKAYNYYLYLYELTGYDKEGNPQYKTVVIPENFFSPEELEQLKRMGMTPKEYLEMMAEDMGMSYDELLDMMVMDKPYNNIGRVDTKAGQELCTYTFTNLDPDKQYYFDIRCHYYTTFSPENIRPVEVVGSPKPLEATDITRDSFTANWEKVNRADGYTVDLYGASKCVADEERFTIFEEDFNATENLTDATDINNPEITGPDSEITFDDLTSTPGWEFGNDDYILLVKGKAGLGVDDYGCYRLTSPKMFTANSDKVILSLCVESPASDYELRIRFAGKVYSLPVTGNKVEGEIELPTFGLAETDFAISGPEDAPIFIDYITVSQALKKGDVTYTWLARGEADKDTFSYKFEDLDPEAYEYYAFRPNALRGDLTSFDNGRMIVNLKDGSSEFNDVDELIAAGEIVEVARYTIDGQRIDRPVKGINIVRYSDGSVRKVMVTQE